MRYLIEKGKEATIKLELEPYIPLKILCEGGKESVNYISYSKNTKSLLEITVGMQSGLIKKITLLLSEEYAILNKKLIINKLQTESATLVFKEYTPVECRNFATYL